MWMLWILRTDALIYAYSSKIALVCFRSSDVHAKVWDASKYDQHYHFSGIFKDGFPLLSSMFDLKNARLISASSSVISIRKVLMPAS